MLTVNIQNDSTVYIADFLQILHAMYNLIGRPPFRTVQYAYVRDTLCQDIHRLGLVVDG